MSKCILRVAKITSQGSATGKTTHNYRLAEVPNADPARKHLNQEYINEGEKNIWTLVNERIEEAGIKKVRKDAVRGMEFLITASPDAFRRDSAGIADDIQNSGWLMDNLNFLADKYGNNLVALTLHQDEKTPHIHAVVVPITADGRLSAKDMFNPISLKKLQTEYAQVMDKYGLDRGIEGSRARHQSMKQIYGTQQQTQQGIESDLQPLQATKERLTIEKPGTLDFLNLDRWRQQQEDKINAVYTQRLEEALKMAQKAQNIAVANATAAQQVKVLQQKLNTSEDLKQANFKKADVLDKIVVLVDEGRVNKEWIHKQAEQIRSKSLPQMEKDLLESIKGLKTIPQLGKRLKEKGYKLVPESSVRYMENPKTRVRIDLTTAQLGGQPFGLLLNQALDQTRQQEAAKQAIEEAKRLANQQKPAPKQDRGRGMKF